MHVTTFTQGAVGATAPLPVRRRLARILGAALLRLRIWRDERRTLAEVARLDEATLRDIGVSRWQLGEQLRAQREQVFLRAAGYRGVQ